MRLGDNFKGRDDIYCFFQAAGVLIDKLCGVALYKKIHLPTSAVIPQTPYEQPPMYDYYDVFTDIDNRYSLYTSDLYIKSFVSNGITIPMLFPIEKYDQYSRFLQIQRAPVAPIPTENEAFRFAVELFNSKNRQNLSPEAAPDETNKSAPEKSATLAETISSKSISLSNPEDKKSEKTSPATDSPDKKTAAKENLYTDELTGLKIIFDDGSEEKKKKMTTRIPISKR